MLITTVHKLLKRNMAMLELQIEHGELLSIAQIHRICTVMPQCFMWIVCFAAIVNGSLVPRLSWSANIYRAESLVSFLRKHDVIKIGPKQKGNVLRVVQLIMLQHSVCMILDAR